MHRVLYSQFEIRYQVYGERGPLVFLIHGFGGGPQDYRELVLELSKHCRCIVPNIRPFFTSQQNLSYDDQVEALRYFIEQLAAGEGKFSIVSSSYGSCLSSSVSIYFEDLIDQHYIINPMPFRPFDKLRSLALKAVLKVSRIPGAMKVFFVSTQGQKMFLKLGRIFNFGSKKKNRFSSSPFRKFKIIERAIDRFLWIDQEVNWEKWEDLTKNRVRGVLIYSTKDPLFSAEDYEAVGEHFNVRAIYPISHRGHFLTQTNTEQILSYLKPLVASSLFYKKTG